MPTLFKASSAGDNDCKNDCNITCKAPKLDQKYILQSIFTTKVIVGCKQTIPRASGAKLLPLLPQTQWNVDNTVARQRRTRPSDTFRHKSCDAQLLAIQFKTMNEVFLPTSRNVLLTFQRFCPIGVQIAQTVLHFDHFQIQVRKRGVLGWVLGYFVY